MSQQLSSYFVKVGGNSKSFYKLTPRKINLITSDNTVGVIDLTGHSDDSEPENNSNIPLKSDPVILCHANQIRNPGSDLKTTEVKTSSSPKKTHRSPPRSQYQSPSKKKFFSPTKNRRIISSPKVKKKLSNNFLNNQSLLVDQSILNDLKSYDDKTQFLLETVYKYLNNDNLRCLLSEDVYNLLSKCMVVVKPGMMVVCRLYWRKRGWYRKDKIIKIGSDSNSYIDVPNFELMIDCLVEHGFIVTSVHDVNFMDFDQLIQVLKANELSSICKEFKLKVKNKADAVKSLKSYSLRKSNISNFMIGANSNNQSRVMNMLKQKTGTCYKLSEAAEIAITKLLYLMNLGMNYEIIREKKLELVFINNKANKETYPIDENLCLDDASVVFNERREFESYYDACIIFEKWEAANSSNEKLEIVTKVFDMYKSITEEDMKSYKSLPSWLRRFTCAYEYIKILDSGVKELKKEKKEQCYKAAVDILNTLISQSAFKQHKKAEWYEEKALILEKHLDSHDKAAEVLLEGLSTNLPEETMFVMRKRANKMATMISKVLRDQLREELLKHAAANAIKETDFESKHIYHNPMERFNNRGKIKFETFTADGERVVKEAEELCIEYYSQQYIHGAHWEGKIVNTIFFLLFWDIIYMKLPGIKGIFLSRFQTYPMDLFTENFYLNRKTLVDERLHVIQNSPMDDILSRMQETWNDRPECELSGICRSIGWDNVAEVCTCLGAAAISAICRRLVMNYHYTHSGFPDLTLWNSYTRQIKFVEVKTDSDVPSIKQLQWMQYLRDDCRVPVEFCYVGVNTTRRKARTRP